jgi:hypothetical protein
MSKYRFKTREEFERDGQWNDEYECPIDWNESGEMNHYLGEDVPEHYNERCDKNWDIGIDSWCFVPSNYVLKEEDYTGRWIKALADNIQCTGVKAGEVIQIISKPNTYRLDKTSSGCIGMSIQCPLNTSEWELLETGVIDIRKDSEKIEVKDDIKPSSFPSSGAVLVLECDDLKEFKKYLFDSGRTCNEAVGNPKYLSWNGTSFWYPTTGTGKTIYQWNQLKHFIPASKNVPSYVRCVQVLMHAKAGKIYPVVDEKHCLCEDGNTYVWDSQEFINSTKQEYDAQFSNEQDPLYICKQEYRKGMRVKSACKTGIYSEEFIIDVEPREFRNLSGNKDVVDYSMSNGYLYFNGEYAEILEEGVYDVSKIIETNKPSVDDTKGIINYITGDTTLKESSPYFIEKTKKPSVESVQSVDVKLRTKKQINKFKF